MGAGIGSVGRNPLGAMLAALLLTTSAVAADEPSTAVPAVPAPAAAGPSDLPGLLRTGRLVRTRGANVLALTLARSAQPGLGAHVGLAGVDATVAHLPGPAGEWHVRIANPLDEPLLIPAGEVLLTPQGPSRMPDRPVWIPRGAATFVPVVQVADPAPEGPYLCRGDLLSPVERTLDDLDRLRARIRFRNQHFGVGGTRGDDAGSAYQTEDFRARFADYRDALASLADGENVVGVMVAGEDGIHFAHVEFDAARFRALWPALLRGIALDAMLVEDAGLSPTPAVATAYVARARALLALLDAEPLTRTNFGRGREQLWSEAGRDEVWRGLTLDGVPVCLSLLRRPPAPAPAPGGAPPPPAGPGPGGTGGSETPVQPGQVELERRGPRTGEEARLRDRRSGNAGGSVPPRPSPPRSGPTPTAPSRPAPVRPAPSTPGGGGSRVR